MSEQPLGISEQFEQITEEELETWESEARKYHSVNTVEYPLALIIQTLLAEVRRQRGSERDEEVVFGSIWKKIADERAAKIEEQAKEIERLQMGIFREETGSENMVGKDQGT